MKTLSLSFKLRNRTYLNNPNKITSLLQLNKRLFSKLRKKRKLKQKQEQKLNLVLLMSQKRDWR